MTTWLETEKAMKRRSAPKPPPRMMTISRIGVNGQVIRQHVREGVKAARRLAILNAAPSLDTLRSLPGNRLEALRGDRTGQYSIRVNLQWRLCFEWPDGQAGPDNVEIVDYHG